MSSAGLDLEGQGILSGSVNLGWLSMHGEPYHATSSHGPAIALAMSGPGPAMNRQAQVSMASNVHITIYGYYSYSSLCSAHITIITWKLIVHDNIPLGWQGIIPKYTHAEKITTYSYSAALLHAYNTFTRYPLVRRKYNCNSVYL